MRRAERLTTEDFVRLTRQLGKKKRVKLAAYRRCSNCVPAHLADQINRVHKKTSQFISCSFWHGYNGCHQTNGIQSVTADTAIATLKKQGKNLREMKT